MAQGNHGGIGSDGDRPFTSVLWSAPEAAAALATEAPSSFPDLHLDQLLAALRTEWPTDDLAACFSTPLRDEDAVRYRQEVFRDLADPDLVRAFGAFTDGMRTMRLRLSAAEQSGYLRERQRWFLDAAVAYRDAVSALGAELADRELTSRGLRGFRRYLLAHVHGERFASFAAETRDLLAALGRIRYVVTIAGTRVTVRPYEGERDFAADVLATFAKFRQGEVRDYRSRTVPGRRVNHVDAQIVDRVARANPEVFHALDRFCIERRDFIDEVIRRFDEEIPFYLSYLAYIGPLTAAGLSCSLPRVARGTRRLHASAAFDLVLAKKLLAEGRMVVTNDVSLDGRERLIVVTGPNQGGKTTFARMIGQLHHLAAIGCPVPGRDVSLPLPDRIFTHFEREEDIATLRGKLEDELVRIREILEAATGDSLVVMNETFTSTTLDDARFLGIEVIRRLTELDVVGVYVTFVDELASLGPATVSMVGSVDPHDPAIRTFEIRRRPADGLAYAHAVAKKHGLSSSALMERLPS